MSTTEALGHKQPSCPIAYTLRYFTSKDCDLTAHSPVRKRKVMDKY